jgi:acetyl-CoA carboxylase biotin carboxyl carrier protein
MNRERILKLNEMLKASGAAELEVREGDERIRLMRAPEPAQADVNADSGAANAVAAEPDPLKDATIVSAHIVGLFHRGSGPGEKPLVEPGDEVSEGQCIGTIEALRNFTEVTCPIDGTVVGVVAEDGQSVQFGDPLLAIRPD